MHSLMLLAFLAADPDDKAEKKPPEPKKVAVQNLEQLCNAYLAVEHPAKLERWIEYDEGRTVYVGARRTWLLLRPGVTHDAGTAWVFQEQLGRAAREAQQWIGPGMRDTARRSDRWQAWKGTFELFIHRSDDEMLVLILTLTRKYDGSGRRKDGAESDVTWEVDTRYQPKRLTVEIPLVEGGVPRHRMQLTIADGECLERIGSGLRPKQASFPRVKYLTERSSADYRCIDFGYIGQMRRMSCLGTEPPKDWFTLPPGVQPALHTDVRAPVRLTKLP